MYPEKQKRINPARPVGKWNKSFLFLFVSLLFLISDSDAANRYWVGTSGANWKTTTSWSTSTGGASGASIPGSGDVAIFDGGAATNCTIDTNVNVSGLQLNSGYTATISQNAYTITIGTSGWNITAGMFSGSSSSITLSGTLTINGGTLTSTSGTLSTNSGITFSSGTFNHNNGTVTITATMTLSGSPTFYNLSFAPAATASTFTISNTPVVDNTLSLAGGRKITLNTGTIDAKGDITITNVNTGGGGTATIHITGTATQTLTGSGTADTGILPNVTINKSSGTLNLSSVISCTGTWTYTTGTVSPGSSHLNTTGTVTLDCQGASAAMSLFNLTVYAGTTTLAGNLDVNHIAVSSGATLDGASYTITVSGNWSNSGTWTYGTSTVEFDGTGYKTLSKSSGTENFYNLKLNRNFAGANLRLASPVIVNNQFILTKSKLITTATLYLELADNATLSGGHDSAYVHGPVLKTGNDAFTFPLGDTTLTTAAYHPLGMNAPGSATDQFQAEYVRAAQSQGATFNEDSLEVISNCEYWKFRRNIGSSSVKPTLAWNTNNCVANAPAVMRVSRWNGSQWISMGYDGSTGTASNGTVSASITNAFGSDSYLVLAQKRHNQYLQISTYGIDTLVGSDTAKYIISGAQLSGTYKAGTLRTFMPRTPYLAGTDSVTLKFFLTTRTDTTLVRFAIDHYAEITNVRVKIDTMKTLDTSLYKIIADTTIALLNGNSTWEEQYQPPVKVILEDGLSMSPDSDGLYDTFVVQGTGGYSSYQLTIYDRAGVQVFQTTNPAIAWDGLDGSSDPVLPGTYSYTIIVDGQSIAGQFLLEY